MTATLVLRLAAPMQAWGTTSRFADRATDTVLSKSGVIGMIMAALGAPRDDTDTTATLAQTGFAVRVDSPGVIETDLQTARGVNDLYPLSQRFYLADACFVAFVQFNDDQSAQKAADALDDPVHTVYLGRKTFLPTGPLVLGVYDTTIDELLTTIPHQGRADSPRVTCDVHRDGTADQHDRVVRDVPVSFHTKTHRDRFVTVQTVEVVNEVASQARSRWFDRFFESLGQV